MAPAATTTTRTKRPARGASSFRLPVLSAAMIAVVRSESARAAAPPKTLFRLPPLSVEHYRNTRRLALGLAWTLGILACLAFSGSHDWFGVLPLFSRGRFFRFLAAAAGFAALEWFRVWRNDDDDGMLGVPGMLVALVVLYWCNRPPNQTTDGGEEDGPPEHRDDTTEGAVAASAASAIADATESTGSPRPWRLQFRRRRQQQQHKSELERTREQLVYTKSRAAALGILAMVKLTGSLLYLARRQGRLGVLAGLDYVGPATVVSIGPVAQSVVPTGYGSLYSVVSFPTLGAAIDPAFLPPGHQSTLCHNNNNNNQTVVTIRDRGAFFSSGRDCASSVRVPRALLGTQTLVDILEEEKESVESCMEKTYPDLAASSSGTTNTTNNGSTTNDTVSSEAPPYRGLYEIVADLDRCLGYDGTKDRLDVFDATTEDSLADARFGLDDAGHGQAYRFGSWAGESAITAGFLGLLSSFFLCCAFLLRRREDELRHSDSAVPAPREVSEPGSSVDDESFPLFGVDPFKESKEPHAVAVAVAFGAGANTVAIHPTDGLTHGGGGGEGGEEKTPPGIEVVLSVPPPRADG